MFFRALRFAQAALLLVVSVACDNRTPEPSASVVDRFDRAAAVARIEARMAQYDDWSARFDPVYERRKAGQDVAAEIEAMKAARPGFADLRVDAERIVQADPTDDAAFKAIEVALRGNRMEDAARWKGSANEALQERMERALLTHHINRREFLDAVYLNSPDAQPQIEFWKQVLEHSPHTSVRASAARSVMKRYAEWAQDTAASGEQREAMRAEVRHYAMLIKSEYAEDGTLIREADGFLAALDNSAGTMLSDIRATTLAGGTDALANYRGKVVLLDFWATWCGACRKDHPKLIALQHELEHQPFNVISVSVDETPAEVTQYLAKEHELPWQQWYAGPQGPVLKRLGIQGYPTYLLVGGDGTLAARGTTLSLNDIMAQARTLVAQLDGK